MTRPIAVAACALVIGLPSGVFAQSEQQVKTACGPGSVTEFASRKIIDVADTAGHNEEVIRITRVTITLATRCLDSLPASSPSAVRVFFRNVILGSLAFEMNAMKGDDHADQLLTNEARIAIDQCNEDDLKQKRQPYLYARQSIEWVLDSAEKVFAYSNTPMDDYKPEVQDCAVKLKQEDRQLSKWKWSLRDARTLR